MAEKKLRTATLLMTISIACLLLFQAYWLRNAYYDEFRRLKRELAVTLRETVVKQQMQLLLKTGKAERKNPDSITIVKTDSGKLQTGVNKSQIKILMQADSGGLPRRKSFYIETTEGRMDDKDELAELKVEFPIPLGLDSLGVVEDEYRKLLADAGVTIPFRLQKKIATGPHGKQLPRIQFKKNGSASPDDMLWKGKFENIEASFDNPFFFIIKRMQWQLFFAFSMLVFTIVAFVFLYRNLRQQHQLAALKNEFIANITHELKTPVATVSVAIEALKNFSAINDAEKTREYLDISALELQRLSLLVDKVMKLSMFEQNKMELQQEKIDLKNLVEDVLKSMKLQFEKHGAIIETTFKGDDFNTRGDRMHLQSVLFNLLDNALKYSPQNPVIEVEIDAKPDKLLLKIADNGMGIAPEFRQKIFEKFFRVPHGDTHNIKGYGLGLSYVFEVVKLHHGSIHIDSREKEGSIFIVELQRAG